MVFFFWRFPFLSNQTCIQLLACRKHRNLTDMVSPAHFLFFPDKMTPSISAWKIYSFWLKWGCPAEVGSDWKEVRLTQSSDLGWFRHGNVVWAIPIKILLGTFILVLSGKIFCWSCKANSTLLLGCLYTSFLAKEIPPVFC